MINVIVSEHAKRYEYCEVDCKSDNIVTICNKHGQQGWLLSCLTTSKVKGNIRIIFHRANRNDSKCIKDN